MDMQIRAETPRAKGWGMGSTMMRWFQNQRCKIINYKFRDIENKNVK